MPFSIAGFPLAPELECYRELLSRPQYRHLVTMLAGLMLNGRGEKNIMDITEAAVDGGDQSCLNRFMHAEAWSAEELNRFRLNVSVRGMKGGALIIDDTLIEKTGHKMEDTGYLYDHCLKKNIWCIDYVTAFYSNGETKAPLDFSTYVKEEVCEGTGKEFKTKTELTVELISKALEYVSPDVVLFDSWYGSKEILNCVAGHGHVFITESKTNRLLWDGDQQIQVKEYLARHKKEFVPADTGTDYRFCMEKVSAIKGGLTVKFIFFRTKKNGRHTQVLMTNALDMDQGEVMRQYKKRWDAEVFYRDCKQFLGMGDYQARAGEVGVTHLLLVFLAYTILKGIACRKLFQNIFQGADSIGSMCAALKRFVFKRMTKANMGTGPP
jgi:hypothetical protein